MTQKNKMKPSSKQIVEETLFILKSIPFSTLLIYYMGAVPFVIIFLFVYQDIKLDFFGSEKVIPYTLLLSIMFLWAKSCKHRFVTKLRETVINDGEKQRKKFISYMSPIVLQLILLCVLGNLVIATFKMNNVALFLFNISGMIIVIMEIAPWYFSLDVVTLSEKEKFFATLKSSFGDTYNWILQKYGIMIVLFFIGLLLFVNIFLVFYLMPTWMSRYLGLNNLFTMSGNVDIGFIGIFLFSYIVISPFITIAMLLRNVYMRSQQSGHHIKSRLQKNSAFKKVVLQILLVAFICVSPLKIYGESSSVKPENVDKTIEKVMKQREYRWKMPIKNETGETVEIPKADLSFLEKIFKYIGDFFSWIASLLEELFTSIQGSLSKLIDFIGDIFKKIWDWFTFGEKTTVDRKSEPFTAPKIRGYDFAVYLGIIVLIFIIVYLVRNIKLSKKEDVESESVSTSEEHTDVDIEDETLTADALPTDQWLALALACIEKGDFRGAIRAFYLSMLASLGEKEFIVLQKYTSNKEYKKQLQRRIPPGDERLTHFKNMIYLYESTWYGAYTVTKEKVDKSQAITESLKHYETAN